jgi:hypothetical protein
MYDDFDYGSEMEAHYSAQLDADLEMAQMAEVGEQMRSQQARGICQHNSAVRYTPTIFYPEQIGLKPGQLRCTDGCGEVFADDEDWDRAMESALYA